MTRSGSTIRSLIGLANPYVPTAPARRSSAPQTRARSHNGLMSPKSGIRGQYGIQTRRSDAPFERGRMASRDGTRLHLNEQLLDFIGRISDGITLLPPLPHEEHHDGCPPQFH